MTASVKWYRSLAWKFFLRTAIAVLVLMVLTVGASGCAYVSRASVSTSGTQGNGTADDTAAIQQAIDAARTRGNGAIAYLPTGRYVITNTLRITGKNFFVGGSGWSTKEIWKGPEGGVMVEVPWVMSR